jgi:hypothetical protein
MAFADTARLATVLTLKDGLSPGLKKTTGSVGKFSKGVDGAGKKVSAFGGKMKTAAAVGAGALGGALLIGIKSGLQNLGELESATTSVEAALKQMGKAGKVTAAQIADWANEIEAATDAAFDDKAITNATTTLLRYGKVTTKNIRPAMEVMTDLAARTGDVDSASQLLARALAKPEKAAGKLAKAGVYLTEGQEKQIKAFVKAGKTGEAQAVILAALEKNTKGAAAAMNGPYVDAQKKLEDAVEDGTKALAVGFLPLITKLSEKLRKGVSDPKVMANIKAFGEGLANAFERGLEFAEKIPWGAIADGIKVSAQWAGKLFDAFRSMPPEVQATIVALAGLNKLSGGAITGIVSELGKGLIKGVLGITAAVVNINAGAVKGAGGVPTAPTTGGGGAGQAIQVVAGAGLALAVGEAMRAGFKEISGSLFPPSVAATLQRISDSVNPLPNIVSTLQGIPDIPAKIGQLGDFIGGKIDFWGNPIVNNVQAMKVDTIAEGIATRNALVAQNQQLKGAVIGVRSTVTARSQIETARLNAIREKQQASINAYRAGERATGAKVQGVSNRLNTANTRLAQIRAKRMSFSTSVNVGVRTSVSVRNVNNSNTTQNNYGSKTTNKVL